MRQCDAAKTRGHTQVTTNRLGEEETTSRLRKRLYDKAGLQQRIEISEDESRRDDEH
jgi:hypothetical protein